MLQSHLVTRSADCFHSQTRVEVPANSECVSFPAHLCWCTEQHSFAIEQLLSNCAQQMLGAARLGRRCRVNLLPNCSRKRRGHQVQFHAIFHTAGNPACSWLWISQFLTGASFTGSQNCQGHCIFALRGNESKKKCSLHTGTSLVPVPPVS